jgi:ubiquinone/menaquinone biosynthesis C-methylase UbiE
LSVVPADPLHGEASERFVPALEQFATDRYPVRRYSVAMAEEMYSHGHHDSVVADHARRSAVDSAAFLVPELDRSMNLLDVGCGPGSITVELASLVASTVGLDASEEAIAWARKLDPRGGVEFVVGSAYELPFEDRSFDVVFGHQVLQHLADPVDALREWRRVLRPGGIVAVRDADYGTMVHDPHDSRIDRWLELYRKVARQNGGEPDAGRRLGRWCASAGFIDLEVGTSTWTYHTRERVEGWRDLWVSRLLEARLGELATSFGFADRAELEDLANAWRDWASADEPFFAFLHGEVIGRAPNFPIGD